MKINGSPVVKSYRTSNWTRKYPVYVRVTSDRKVWHDVEYSSHAGDCGRLPDDIPVSSRDAVLRFANC
jgi:hypothetical protein